MPLFEVHVNTPLNHRGTFRIPEDPAVTPDWVDLTLGTTLEFASQATLGLGFAFPLTGPKPFDVEAIAQLNFRF